MSSDTMTAYEKYIQPILDKYEITDPNGKAAVIDAFKAALQYAREVMNG